MNGYPDYEAMARLEYGRLLWRKARMRQALLGHWTDPRHPYRDRFEKHRAMVELVLESTLSDEELDAQLRVRGASLRTIRREIPPVFGHFWKR